MARWSRGMMREVPGSNPGRALPSFYTTLEQDHYDYYTKTKYKIDLNTLSLSFFNKIEER